jgi:hypothetical protein
VKFLSQEFLDALPDADRAPFGDATGVISVKTEGGPDGKVAVTVELEHGRVVGARPKASKEAAVELAAPYELAAELFRGDADPAVEFMRGNLKMSGDMGLWLEILPAWHRHVVAGNPHPVVAATEF